MLPVPVSSIQALALGLPAACVQGYGDPAVPYGYRDLSLFVQDDWRLTDRADDQGGPALSESVLAASNIASRAIRIRTQFPADNNNVAPRLAVVGSVRRRASVHAAYGLLRQPHHRHGRHRARRQRRGQGADAAAAVPQLAGRVERAGPSPAARSRAGGVPSVEISIDPGMKTPCAHHTSFGVERELPNRWRCPPAW